MSDTISIAILCGGQSVEHEVSILSANNVAEALDPEKYAPMVIYLSQHGRWYWVDLQEDKHFSNQTAKPLFLVPGRPGEPFGLEQDSTQSIKVDCVIPMLHGTNGEDGSVQGLLEMLNVPYVGANVLGSAVCMNKHVAKSLLRFAGLPTTDWVHFNVRTASQFPYKQVEEELGSIVFVKPVSLGSSVGIAKVRNQEEYDVALGDAFQYDHAVIVERYVPGREVECSVLGNHEPVASLPGELITQHEFYTYEAKYCDPDSLQIITPAELPESTTQMIQELSIHVFQVLGCCGMARVDFFVTAEQEVLISEANTIPGFTNLSIYPKNWNVSGLSYPDLLENLINLAVERHAEWGSLSRHYLNRHPSTDDIANFGEELG